MKNPRRQARVTAFLRSVLAEAPQDVLKLEAMARTEGLLGDRQRITHAKPFKRGKHSLRIRSVRAGFGPSGVFMALFEGQVSAPHAVHGLARLIRNLAIGSKPSDQWVGGFDEFGVPLTGLRARLFAMLPANDERARLAEQCLIVIEEHRDDRGRVSNEPRHPDIVTGRAWPPEADEPPVVLSFTASEPEAHDRG